jgi:hypothetical protein
MPACTKLRQHKPLNLSNNIFHRNAHVGQAFQPASLAAGWKACSTDFETTLLKIYNRFDPDQQCPADLPPPQEKPPLGSVEFSYYQRVSLSMMGEPL